MVRPLPSYTQMISPSPAPQGHDVRNRDQYIKLLAAAATSVIILSFWASVLFCFRPSPSAPSWITFECTYPRQEPVFTMPQDCPSNYADYAKSFHEPGSGGPLNLSFQRPIEACRKFTSDVINTVIDTISSKMANVDLARLFTNAFPNTLDTTIQGVACLNNQTATDCNPLAFIITGDINAMWLRDSANQLMPYLEYVNQDWNLKRLFLGAIYMQAQFIQLDPYANAFNEPASMDALARNSYSNLSRREVPMKEGVYERKWEVDSLASFLGLSYNYWSTTGDDSFVDSTVWLDAVDQVIKTVKEQQEPTFDPATGKPLDTFYTFSQQTDRPTETQFLDGRGNPVKRTGMVKSLFRPSDDATVYPFFIPGNAMISVELGHVSQLLEKTAERSSKQKQRMQVMANETQALSKEIRDAIFTYGITTVPGYDKVFAFEVDGYGSTLIMDDANMPSLLSLSMIGFIDSMDPIYQSTRKLVLSRDNPYYFSGPRARGIGGPHIGLDYAWPMSQIVRILSSQDDAEIKEALDIILHSTDGTGLIHESVNVYDDDKEKYTRPWFAWVNGLFGQAILKIAKERPYLIFKE